MWIELGRQPTTTDIKNGVSRFSLQCYLRRFGGWRAALSAFIDFIESDTQEDNDKSESWPTTSHEVSLVQSVPLPFERISTREVNYRLRFKVMQRDKFKCIICGASPAKDPSIELHVDHIIPWSKGGETVIENLQTLCSKCNLGKSDLDI